MDYIQDFLDVADNYCTMKKDIEYFKEFIYDKSLSCEEYTVIGYSERLKYIVKYFGEHKLSLTETSRSDVKAFIHHMKHEKGLSPSTINGRITLMRMFYNWLQEEYAFEIDPTKGIKKLSPQKLDPYEKIVAPEDIGMILREFKRGTFLGDRNVLIAYLMYDGFLRRGEVVKIRLEDVEFSTGLIKVSGKGKKNRVIQMSAEVRTMLRRYARKYKDAVNEYLICTRRGDKLNSDAIRQIFYKIYQKTGIKSTPHLYRHSGIHEYLADGGSLATAAARAGHSDPKITYSIYAHLVGKENMRSIERFSPARKLKKKLIKI